MTYWWIKEDSSQSVLTIEINCIMNVIKYIIVESARIIFSNDNWKVIYLFLRTTVLKI